MDGQVFSFPAHVVLPPDNADTRLSEETLLKRVRETVRDPKILEDHEPFFWPARISTNELDTFYTHMGETTLRNYARDAEAGVAFQDSHRSDGMVRTLGRSLSGRFVTDGDIHMPHTIADFYTLRGVDPTIDTFIDRVRGGLAQDVSVGFTGGKYICSICGRDMRSDYECMHWPGVSYSKDAGEGKKAEKILCTARIEDAHLAEVSAVYAGSNPSAMILRAERMIEAGELDWRHVALLEQTYRTKFPSIPHTYVLGTLEQTTDQQEARMPGKDEGQRAPETDNTLDRIKELLATRTQEQDPFIAVRTLLEENDRLRPLADDGRRYKADLVAAALTEGRRAYGQDFSEETYKGILEGATIDAVKRITGDWKAAADIIFQGGRRTVDGDETTGNGGGQVTVQPVQDYSTYRA